MAKVRALVDALTGTRPERPGPGGGTWPERPDRNDLVWQSVSVNPGRGHQERGGVRTDTRSRRLQAELLMASRGEQRPFRRARVEGAAPDATASGSDRIGGSPPNDVSTPLGSSSKRHAADGAAPESRHLSFDPRNSRAYLSVQDRRQIYIGRYNNRQEADAAAAAVLLTGAENLAAAATDAQRKARGLVHGPVPLWSHQSTADGRRNLLVKWKSNRYHLGAFRFESTARSALDAFLDKVLTDDVQEAREVAKRMALEERFTRLGGPDEPHESQDMVTACPGIASRLRVASSKSTSCGPPVAAVIPPAAVTPPGMFLFVRSSNRVSIRSSGAQILLPEGGIPPRHLPH